MSNCDFFVFGRTLTIDYRWLLKPKAPLNEVFFSRTLEFSARELGAGKRLFVSERSNGYCVFSTFFLFSAVRDERGRPIAFAVGITCPDSLAREFNYRLPALISEAERLERIMSDELSVAVRTDGLIASRSLDITGITPKSDTELAGLHLGIDNFEAELPFRATSLSCGNEQFSPTTQALSANPAVSPAHSVGDLAKISAELRACIDTPQSMANYDMARCGSIFDGSYIGNRLLSTGKDQQLYDRVPSKVSQPSTSLLDQADALLGSIASKTGRVGSQGGHGDVQVQRPQPNQEDSANSPQSARPESESEQSPGLFDTLGAVLGALSGTSKRGRKPD